MKTSMNTNCLSAIRRSIAKPACVALLACGLLLSPLSSARAQFELPTAETTQGGDPKINDCQIDLVEDIDLPASEAGLLTFLGITEGQLIKSEEVLAKIDPRQAEMQKRVAKYGLRSATKQANNNVEIEYSKAAALVAEAEYQRLLDTNAHTDRAVPDADVDKAKLDWERSIWAIKKAEVEKELAMLDAWTKKAEVDASEMAIDRLTIRAPFDGQVIEMFRDQQEWVQPGEPIARVARLDTLQVDALMSLDDYSPSEVDGCDVTLEVTTTRGKKVQATGRVVFINPLLLSATKSRPAKMMLRAEISNRLEQGHWIILPGMRASMTIHLGTGGTASASRRVN